MARDGRTEILVTPGVTCALCGAAGRPGLNVPVFRASDSVPAFPLVCRDCLAPLLAIALSLLAHSGERVAEIATSVQVDT
jgi:hypothetical protein